MILNKFLIIIFILIFSISSFADTNNKEIKIAAVLGLTGSATVHSTAIKKGVLLAVEKLKEDGIKVDIKFEDDQTNPMKTVTATKLLIGSGYKYFIGPVWSFLAKAAKPIMERANVVSVLPTGASSINGGASSAFFNLYPNPSDQKKPLINWLKTTNYKRALIITPNGDWGEEFQKVFSEVFKELNRKVVSNISFNHDEIDLNSLKSIFLRERSKNFDIIITTGSAKDIASIVKAKNQLNLTQALISSEDLIDARNLGILTSKDLIGEYFVTHLKPPSKEFSSLFEKQFNEPAHLYADRAYDALMVLVKAIRETDGSVDKVKDYLFNKLEYTGVTGEVKFDSNGDYVQEAYEVVFVD